ncbi:MAG: hypothetical protein OHK0039_28520 [Bacteroidia bacterium]
MNRRIFVQQTAALGTAALLGSTYLHAQPRQPGSLVLSRPSSGLAFRPLESLRVAGATGKGRVFLLDGRGQHYGEQPAGADLVFDLGGAAGPQWVVWLDAKDRLMELATFTPTAETFIDDGAGTFGELLRVLR